MESLISNRRAFVLDEKSDRLRFLANCITQPLGEYMRDIGGT